MREIKFRAWDKSNEEMLEVENLYFNDMTDKVEIRTRIYSDYFNDEEMILMQYTGLKDKNGKEIYEGDIVAEKGHYVKSDRLLYQKIQWKESYSCWLRGEYQRLTPKNIKTYQIEVIGNIYENPELLEVKNG